MSIYPAENVTDTGLTFTAVLPATEGSYDVILRNAVGTELGREAVGITVVPVPLGIIDRVIPDTIVTTNPTTLHAQGSGLATVDHVTLTDAVGTASEVTVTGATDTTFPFDYTAAAAGTWTVTAKAGGATGTVVAELADAFTAIAAPTSPVIFGVFPPEMEPYDSVTLSTIYGWLLDPADCLSYHLDGVGGGGNMTGLDFTNTGLTMPWAMGLAPGSWTFEAKQGGSGGTMLASLVSAVVVAPVHADTIIPDTAITGVATDFVITGGGLAQCDAVEVRDAADVLIVSCPRTDWPATMSPTEVAFTATIPNPGVYDLHLTVNMDMGPGLRMSAALTVADPPPPEITSVAPTTAVDATPTTFTVTGTGLAATTQAALINSGTSNTSTAPVTNVSDTGFTFEWANPYDPGVAYHLAAKISATNTEIARLDNAITVTSPGTGVQILTVTPDTAIVGDQTNFIVTGTLLTQIDNFRVIKEDGNFVGVVPIGLTDDGFAFVWSPVALNIGVWSLVGRDATDTEITRLTNCITVTDGTTPPSQITSVTPTDAEDSVITHFVVTGTGLTGMTFAGYRSAGSAGSWTTTSASLASGTGFEFDAALTAGTYDIAAIGAAGNADGDEIAKLANAIVVGTATPPPPPAITSVTPSNMQPGISQTYTVTGVSLGATTKAGRRNNGLTDESWADIAVAGVTDTGFTFTQNFGETVLDIAAFAGSEKLAQKDAAITVLNTTPRIDTIDPSTTWVNHSTIWIVTGYGLLEVSTIRIGTSGVGFDDWVQGDFTTFTDTQIVFEGSVTRTGLHDVIGNQMGGTAYIRKDDCLQINSQLVVSRGTEITAQDLGIDCGTDEEVASRLDALGFRPDDETPWGHHEYVTIRCADDSRAEVRWTGTDWASYINLTVLTRGETKSARDLGIGRCAMTRAGTAKRLNSVGVVADPTEAWIANTCAYVLCNSGVHDEVRWNGTAWEECV